MEYQNAFSSLSNEVFYGSAIQKGIVESYKELLIKEVKKQNNKSTLNLTDLFFNITNYPVYLITKLINAVTSNNQTLSVDSFMDFLYELFTTSSLEKRIECLFRVFDFNSNNLVNYEDICFLFENLYMIKYKSIEYLPELQQILKDTQMRHCMTKDVFVKFIIEENSDIFYLFFLLLSSDNLFSKDYIDYFIKYNSNLKKEDLFLTDYPTDKDFQRPSELLMKFSKEALNLNVSLEEANDLFELEEFENNITTCISVLEEEKRKSVGVSSKCLINFKNKLSSLNLINLEGSSKSAIEMPFVSASCKNVMNFNEVKEKKSSINVDIDSIFCEAKIRKLIYDEESNHQKMEKAIIVIKKKIAFIIKRYCKKKEIVFKVKSIYILNNLYASIDSGLLDSSTKKKYYSLLLQSSNPTKEYRKSIVLSTKKEKLYTIASVINKAKNYRDINSIYSFESEIAKGAFGTIYLAVNKLTNRKVAIKKISKSIPNQAWIWEQNIFTIIMLNPNSYLIKCFDSFESLSSIYLIYEYLPYGTLRSFLNDTKTIVFSNELFAFQLMTAIQHLHRFGIVHRDIKPDNLLINYAKGTYMVKLIDFGLGKILCKNDTTSEPFGSLAYSAPEIVAESQYCYSPDIWSIGMIIYFIIHNRDPFSEWKMNMPFIQKMIIEGDVKMLFGNRDKYKGTKYTILFQIMKMCLIKKNRPSIEELTNDVNEMIYTLKEKML